MPFNVTQSTIGVDLNNTDTTGLFALGTRVTGTGDSVWVYVRASTSVTAYKVVAIATNGYCGMASGADVLGGLPLGVAQTAIPASTYAWVPLAGGPFGVMTTGSCSIGNAVYVASSSTPTGIASISASGSCTMLGIYLVAVVDTANASVANCVLDFPKPKSPGGL